MLPGQPIKFGAVTLDRFKRIRALIRAQADESKVCDAHGVYAGGATGEGVTIGWHYEEAELSLTVECVSKPWYLTADMVARKIRNLVEAVP